MKLSRETLGFVGFWLTLFFTTTYYGIVFYTLYTGSKDFFDFSTFFSSFHFWFSVFILVFFIVFCRYFTRNNKWRKLFSSSIGMIVLFILIPIVIYCERFYPSGRIWIISSEPIQTLQEKKENRISSLSREEYKKLVNEYELVGKWEESQYSTEHIKSVIEIYKKGNKFKCATFWGDDVAILELEKKEDKYIIPLNNRFEYYRIENGVLQLWDNDGNTNYIYEPIDW
ncbi:MAG: hypothetical protein CMD01_03480 [Flavobacteriales bacterium]|nr:hypothetical protein [Flavobacteriales bacterium]